MLLEQFQPFIDEGLITKREHPFMPLSILNYSDKCMWERRWTPETMMCRGLVVTEAGEIVARPFPKFFNYQELPQIPSEFEKLQHAIAEGELFQVSEKLDGSLIICFQWAGQLVVASRGSFTSQHVWWAEEILLEQYPDFMPPEGYTYLFELIHPENPIVVNYHGQKDLFLLAVIHTESGVECIDMADTGFPEPWVSEDFADLDSVLNYPQAKNREGFVVTFLDSGFRVKFKWDEYKRLHKMLTGVTPKTIWEILSAGSRVSDVAGVPDEWMQWVMNIELGLKLRYSEILWASRLTFERAKLENPPDRKGYAEIFKQTPFPAILFKMLDGRDPSDLIWKMVKPEGGGAFRCSEG